MWYIFCWQILSAEEHLKRQNCAQGMLSRPPLPLQVDNTTDSGSMIKVNTPRIGKDVNHCGEFEGGKADDVSNHNVLSRHLIRTSSSSPCSDSQQRKPVSNTVFIQMSTRFIFSLFLRSADLERAVLLQSGNCCLFEYNVFQITCETWLWVLPCATHYGCGFEPRTFPELLIM